MRARQTEARKRFYASIRELAAGYGGKVPITTNAQDGRSYSGIMLGALERGGHYCAVYPSYDEHVVLHRITEDELPVIGAVMGKKIEITCRNDGIGEIREESQRLERSGGWNR
jgi:hypothetical protein